jgi:hypothetical protein
MPTVQLLGAPEDCLVALEATGLAQSMRLIGGEGV